MVKATLRNNEANNPFRPSHFINIYLLLTTLTQNYLFSYEHERVDHTQLLVKDELLISPKESMKRD